MSDKPEQTPVEDSDTETEANEKAAEETTPEATPEPTPEVSVELDPEVRTLAVAAEALDFLSISQRKLGLRIVPYDTVAESKYGAVMFKKGAFGPVNPADVRLRMDHEDPPTGRGITFEDRTDAAYMEFSVAKTGRGDDQLTLARDGISKGASVGFMDVVGGPRAQQINGKRVTVYGPDSARLAEVSTTWQPTFEGAQVTHIMHKETPVEQVQEIKELGGQLDKVMGAFAEWQDEMRKSIVAPPVIGEAPRPKLYNWAQVALQMMRGQAVSPAMLREFALDDVVTSENPGLVPDVLTRDFDDLIMEGRPFINSLRQVAAPSTGMSLIVPAIVTRAVSGTQSAEKSEISGTVAPKVGTITFPYSQVFGGADVAIQMLNRGDASFFDLLTQLLGEAYAMDAEGKALDALLNPTGTISGGGGTIDGPEDGGVLDPEDPHFGQAWATSIEVYRRAPDTIWMNAAAVAAFIDAKAPLTNAPLYSTLAASFTAGGGAGGTLSGMRPIYVPAMDEAEVDVIIGPSRSYVYAEDPARTLQVDVPSKAGRDIALVGGFFFGPRAAAAFTTYTVASS